LNIKYETKDEDTFIATQGGAKVTGKPKSYMLPFTVKLLLGHSVYHV